MLPSKHSTFTKRPTRIQIIGYSGAGKSTLATTLGALLSLPVLHLDNVHFYGDWQERSTEEMNVITRKFLADNDKKGWIIDGSYSRVAPERFFQADLSIFLDFNRWLCLWSCFKRWWTWRGRARGSCPCPEKFDWEFVRWILWDGRGREGQQKHFAHLVEGKGDKFVLWARWEVEELVDEVRKNIRYE